MNKFIILLACVALSSCRQTKTLTEYKELVRTDTIKSERIVEKFRAVHDTLIVPLPCDSSGMLSRFYSRLVLPNGFVTIKSEKGNIMATVDIDSMRQEIQNNYRNSQVKSIEYVHKQVIKYRVPTWVIILLVAELAIVLAFLYFKLILRY